jgi:hypothetical protein
VAPDKYYWETSWFLQVFPSGEYLTAGEWTGAAVCVDHSIIGPGDRLVFTIQDLQVCGQHDITVPMWPYMTYHVVAMTLYNVTHSTCRRTVSVGTDSSVSRSGPSRGWLSVLSVFHSKSVLYGILYGCAGS